MLVPHVKISHFGLESRKSSSLSSSIDEPLEDESTCVIKSSISQTSSYSFLIVS